MAFDSAPSAVHYDEVLTNLTLNWVTEQNFIADKIFPVVGVDKKSDEFYKFDPDEANREVDADGLLLAPRTEPKKFDVSHGMDSYMAKVYGLGFDIDVQTQANSDEVLMIRERKAQQLMHKLLSARDRHWISTFLGTGKWGQDIQGVSGTPSTNQFKQWDDASSTPIDDMRSWKRQFAIRNYGLKVNKMVITQDIVDALMANTQILGRINGGASIANPAFVDMALLAQVFGVEEVVVADAVTNTAAVGATADRGYMVENQILLTHTPASAGLDTPASGLIFAWNSLPNASWGITMESFTDDALARQQIAEQVHGKMAYDMKVVGESLGTYVYDVISG